MPDRPVTAHPTRPAARTVIGLGASFVVLTACAVLALVSAPVAAQETAAQKASRGSQIVPGPVPKGTVLGCTGAAEETRLRVSVYAVREAKGLMTVTLYPDDPDDFLARTGKIARLRVPATIPTTEVCLVAPGPGGYAIAVYHDVNANRDFDRTIVGLPAEPYGLSNDANAGLGLPPFKEVLFQAKKGDNRVPITLRQ